MTLPKHSPEASRRCQALNRVGSQCRNAGTAYHPLNAHHEALLCSEHQRQAREGDVRVVAFQTREATA